MLKAYREGEDLHVATAHSITGREKISKDERQLAKAINFGLLYGQGAAGIQNYARDKYEVKDMNLEKAEHYRERWLGGLGEHVLKFFFLCADNKSVAR
jgi:DNA polymerase I